MSDKIYAGDWGVKIIYKCNEVISDATSLSYRVIKPGGTVVVWTAQVYDLDTTGHSSIYATQPGELEKPGQYLVNLAIERGSVSYNHAETMSFVVYELGD